MPLTLRTGDLFAFGDFDALAQGVNCKGVMGKGIAVEFKRRWPLMFAGYRAACDRGELRPGLVHVWSTPGEPVIFNVAIKDHWRSPAATVATQQALARMVAEAEGRGVRRLGMPRIGCGLGGLPWGDIRPLLERLGAGTQVELVVVSLADEAR